MFDIDLEHGPQCGGDFRIIAAIQAPAVIVKILTHLGVPRARAAALPGASAVSVPGGLILKPIAVAQRSRRSGSAYARAKRSDCVEVKRFGPMEGSNSHREWGVFRHHRAIDRFLGRPYSCRQ